MKRNPFLVGLSGVAMVAMYSFGSFSAIGQESETGNKAKPEVAVEGEPQPERPSDQAEDRGRPRVPEGERENPGRGERKEEGDRPARGGDGRGRGEHNERENPDRARAEGGERSRLHNEGREGGPEAKFRHLFEAAEHLELAGFGDEARKFREMAEHMRAESQQHRENEGMDEIHRNMKHLQEVVEDLQRQNAELREKVSALPKNEG